MTHNDLFLNLKNHILPNSNNDSVIFGNVKNSFGEASTLLQLLECSYYPDRNVLQGIITDYNLKLKPNNKGITLKSIKNTNFMGNSININDEKRYSTFKIKPSVTSVTRNKHYSYNDIIEICVHGEGIIVSGNHDICTKTLDNISGKLFTNKIYSFNNTEIKYIRTYQDYNNETVYKFVIIIIYNNSDVIQSVRIYDIEYNFGFEDITDLFQNRHSIIYNSFLHEIKETNEFIRQTENYYTLES